MRRVIIESPYASSDKYTIDQNIDYARRCVRNSVLRGEAPIASHLLFTQDGILRDHIAEERKLGIEAGLAWREVAELSVFYTDHGWSSGMLAALWSAIKEHRDFQIRSLTDRPRLPASLDEDVEELLRTKLEH